MIQDTAALDSIVAQIAFWSEFFSKLLDVVRGHIAALTPREWQVFGLIVRGNTNKQVARALGRTERTIKAHRHMVMEKMQVRSLAELVSLAERVGVLDSESGS